MFSIAQELMRLEPISLDEQADTSMPPSVLGQWDELTKALGRLGKQQFRANQNMELALQQAAVTLNEVQENARAVREQCDEYRRELQNQRQDARDTRLTALATVDMLDDLLAMMRQTGDPSWISRIERLARRALDTLAQMGVSEIPAMDCTFDEKVHEAVDMVARDDREPYTVVGVIQRGFRYEGVVLRRAQVVATR